MPTPTGTGAGTITPTKSKDGELIYREMALNPDGSFVQSPLEGAPNAKQMGVRTPESSPKPDITPVEGLVGPGLTGAQGLSASNPPRDMLYKGTATGVVNTNILPPGLKSIIDNPTGNPTHRSIMPAVIMPQGAYQTLLNSIPWVPIKK
jgi:hypothetical protein